MGPFSQYATYADLKALNLTGVSHTFLSQSCWERPVQTVSLSPCQREQSSLSCLCFCHQVALLDVLSPKEKAELILDPDSGALENDTLLREVLEGLKSQDDEKLSQFFQTFADINKQVRNDLRECNDLQSRCLTNRSCNTLPEPREMFAEAKTWLRCCST